ncbi:MAG: right-handed parallel beta-helix repeat-containing protein [Phycisphaerales bacterium]
MPRTIPFASIALAAILALPAIAAPDKPAVPSRPDAPVPNDDAERGGPVLNMNTQVFYATLQAAIDDASPNDNLSVTNTTLNEVDVLVDKPLTIIGQGNGGLGVSILDPNSAGRCMTISHTGPVRIIGMMFRNGRVDNDDGAGVRVDDSTVSFEGCIFLQCHAFNGLAGALFPFGGSSVTLDACNFLQNSATQYALMWGPGGVGVTMTNCQISDNGALDEGVGELVFMQNESQLHLINCTLARNGFGDDPGQYLLGADGPPTYIEADNCIIWGNQGAPFAAPNATASRCILQGDPPPNAFDNIDADPMFRDFDNFDFRLAPGSPAIDAAYAFYLAEYDPVTQIVTSYRTSDAFNEFRYFDDPRTPDTGAGAGVVAGNSALPNLAIPDIGAHEFHGGECAADLALPFGVLDFSDVFQFLVDFGAGCP